LSYQEKAITFDCLNEHLVGVISQPCAQLGSTQNPQTPAPTTGLIVIVGGPQYRAGSHRQFVLLARGLASAGIPVLRFDYRGMGDSTSEVRTFDNVNDDIAAAASALQASVPSITNIVLWGLCDGASAALLFCHSRQDARISGLCLLNPWVRSEVSLAKTQVKHYYTQRLRQKEFWLKLIRGKVAVSAAAGLIRNVRAAVGHRVVAKNNDDKPFQTRMAEGWMHFNGPMLLILSGSDYVAKEFLEYSDTASVWKNCLKHGSLTRQDISEADHTFSSTYDSLKVADLTRAWLSKFCSLREG
jgi:exosortase A-associated hydrolase 1